MYTPAIPSSTVRTIGLTACRPYIALACAMLAAFAVWLAALGEPIFPLDDAYITLHNADALLRGRDENYGVPPLVGTTSSLHLALVSLLAIPFGLAAGNALCAWFAATAYLAGLLFAARRHGLAGRETSLLLILGAACGYSAYHLLNGLETGLAMAAVTWVMILALQPPRRLQPVLLAILPFLRPELAVLSAALGLHHAAERWRAGQKAALLGDSVLAGAVAAPWLLWMWLEAGAPVPQTIAAKRSFFAEEHFPLAQKLQHAAGCVGRVIVQIGPLTFGLAGLIAVRAGRTALIASLALLVPIAVYFPGGLFHNHYRYLYPLVPLFLLGFAIALGRAAPVERRWLSRGLLVCALWAIPMGWHAIGRYGTEVAFSRTERAEVARWIEANLPRDARVAVHDAGYLAYASDRPLIDIVGLKTPDAQAIHAAITAPSGGTRRAAALDRILAQTDSRYLVVWREWDSIFAITAGLRREGWTVETMREGDYRVARLTLPANTAR